MEPGLYIMEPLSRGQAVTPNDFYQSRSRCACERVVTRSGQLTAAVSASKVLYNPAARIQVSFTCPFRTDTQAQKGVIGRNVLHAVNKKKGGTYEYSGNKKN